MDHPTKIVLIYAPLVSENRPVMATVVYNDEELEKILKQWNDGYHKPEWMDIDYSIREE